MVNFDPLAAEIGPVVWGTPANFNGFRVLAALLHRWSVCVPLLIFPCTIKSRSSFLALAHPGGPGNRAVKRLCVCVLIKAICSCVVLLLFT